MRNFSLLFYRKGTLKPESVHCKHTRHLLKVSTCISMLVDHYERVQEQSQSSNVSFKKKLIESSTVRYS